MKWTKAISTDVIGTKSVCQLIIVGETMDGQAFCYEDSFHVLKASSTELVVALNYPLINPLEKLYRISFIEFSFREKGILYYSFVELKDMENRRQQCVLTLIAPEELNTFQNRRFARINLPSRIPVTCRIVGVRGNNTHQSVRIAGQLLDVAGGGLSFITSTRLFYPLFLELNFELPNLNEQFRAYGEILRVSHFSSDSYRIAVEFRATPESTIAKIDQYCRTYS